MVGFATILAWTIIGYICIGLVFAIAFVTVGVGKIDRLAENGSWGFRILMVPGSVALWPWLAWRWMWRPEIAPEQNAHRLASKETS